jgi:phosphoglycolate phosphatase-like HAD superfamily hydrolase
MRFRYLLWDFDGTLFDTYPPLIRSIEQALADFGITEPHEEIVRLLNITLADCATTLVERHHLDAAQFDARVDAHHANTTLQDRPPFPGVIRVCERLAAAGGANYIFTHRPRPSLYEFLEAFGVSDLFADCLSTADGYARKPDPAGFVALIERHALPREHVLAVGDRDLDILAGQGAGVRTCLFKTPPSPEVTPDYWIDAFDELEELLDL